MSVRAKLFPMTMLALVAGCSPASDKQASTSERDRPGPVAAAEPLAPPSPSPRRAAILPNADPAMAGRPAAPVTAAADGAGQVADAKPAMHAGLLLPMKPSVVNIPPPAYVPDLPPADGVADPAPFPEEVTRYMVDRDGCDHFRGEEAYDPERAAYLQENITELCTGTDARLAMLRRRYANDPAVMSALSGYDNRVEGNASQ